MKKIILIIIVLTAYAGGLWWKNGVIEAKKNRHISTTPEIQRTQGTPVNSVVAKEGEFHKEFRVSGFLQKDGTLHAQVSSEWIGNLKAGQSVEMRQEKQAIKGTITEVSTKPNLYSGLYQVKFSFKHFPNDWIDHLKVVYVPYRTIKGNLILPRESVSLRDGTPKVYVIEDNKIKITKVQISETNNLYYAISSGISPNTEIVSSDQRYLENGEKVKVVPSIEQLIKNEESSQEQNK